MKEHDQICENLINIIKNEDINKYAGDAIWDFIQILCDIPAVSSIKNLMDMIFHIPTLNFWNKMQQFLLGTYRNWEEQIKMSNKFSEDNKKYKEYVYQLLETIDKLDSKVKVSYYSNLTRSFLLELIDEDLFYKLRQILMSSTITELEFVNKHKENEHFDYNIMIFALKNYGLMDQITDDTTYYIFTDLAKRLKEHALNGDDNPKQKVNYVALKPPEDLTPMTENDVEKIFNGSKLYSTI